MDNQFAAHNSHLDDAKLFASLDPQLRNLQKQPYIFHSKLIQALPQTIPGIYTLGGGRQIGKTTLLKQWMLSLLEAKHSPKSIYFLTGEIIEDHHSLIQILQNYLPLMPEGEMKFIIIDEVTYIKDWDKAIKFLADSGSFENTIVMLTGSDLTMLQQIRSRFPGRRGHADQTDFHLYPLSFREFVTLLHGDVHPKKNMKLLSEAFDQYLLHGGFLTAINDLKRHGKISHAIFNTYSDWIRGDILKHGKSESYLKEFLSAMLKTYGSQVTWNSLADHTSIDHPQTIQDYAQLLQYMDAVFIQHALLEDKLLPAPKKAKKIIFADPFIYHSIRFWLADNDVYTPEPSAIPTLVEACVVSHYRRFYPTYYIKSEGEVDIAYLKDKKFWPVEIKWTSQLRPKDLKQISKYNNGLILTKSEAAGYILSTPTYPLCLALYEMDQKH